jgi:hypothetical protein
MPSRFMKEWRYNSTYTYPWHFIEVSGLLHASAILPLGKSIQFQLYRRLESFQIWSGCCGEEKKLSSMPGMKP